MSSTTVSGIHLLSNTSKTMETISIAGVKTISGCVNGIKIESNLGYIDTITISNSILYYALTPISESGSVGRVISSPTSVVTTLDYAAAITYNVPVDDDNFYIIEFRKDLYSSVIEVSFDYAFYGKFIARVSSSPDIYTVLSHNIDGIQGTLDGTTGADGKITIGVVDKKIYIENRVGYSVNIQLTVLSSYL